MRIVEKRVDKIKFSDVKVGEVFKFNNLFYMKTERVEYPDRIISAVVLCNGNLTNFCPFEAVEKANAFLKVE